MFYVICLLHINCMYVDLVFFCCICGILGIYV